MDRETNALGSPQAAVDFHIFKITCRLNAAINSRSCHSGPRKPKQSRTPEDISCLWRQPCSSPRWKKWICFHALHLQTASSHSAMVGGLRCCSQLIIYMSKFETPYCTEIKLNAHSGLSFFFFFLQGFKEAEGPRNKEKGIMAQKPSNFISAPTYIKLDSDLVCDFAVWEAASSCQSSTNRRWTEVQI